MDVLQGIKVIDFTRLLPGPLATHMLAQMGAEVLKIESPVRMDNLRLSGVQIDGASFLFHQLNHNKKQLTIDYNSEDGKQEILELLQSADILIEQFRPGAMKAWGLDYEAIKAVKPDIIYVSLTGYGHNNKWSKAAGHDLNFLAWSGVSSLIKDETGKPVVPDTQFADVSGSNAAIMAIQAAIIKKLKTGEGGFVDVSIANSISTLLMLPYSLQKSGMDPKRFNIVNGDTTTNYSIYQCADGKWFTVAAVEVKFWNRLCDCVDRPDWKRDSELELMNAVFPKEEVIELFKSKTQKEWSDFFKDKDVCVAPVLELEDLESSDIHKSLNTFYEFNTSGGEKITGFSLPFDLRS